MPYLRAATDTPFGAMPYDQVLGMHPYGKDASAAAIYPGDFVTLETDGSIEVATTSQALILGVAAEYSAASTAKLDFLVYDHPDQKFTIQDDSAGTGMTAASIGANADITVTTGNTTTLRSAHEIDSSTVATTATLALKILGMHPIEGGTFATTTGEWRKWIVKINSHQLGGYETVGI